MPNPNVTVQHVPANDSNLQGFLRAALANHADLQNSLVLADYLQDHDDPRAEIARRHGNGGDSPGELNPEGKRLYVKSHADFIPLSPADKTSWGIPAQSVRVHVYGVSPGKDRPASPNRRLEEQRAREAVPVSVRLAFGVTESGAAGSARHHKWGAHFAPHEAVRLVERFHPEAAKRLKEVIAQGFGGTLPSSEPPATPSSPAGPDAIDHNKPVKPKLFADAPDETYTEQELIAAYARMRAEGDDAACQRLRRMMARAPVEEPVPPA